MPSLDRTGLWNKIKEKYQEIDEFKSLMALLAIFLMAISFAPHFFTGYNLGMLSGQMAVVATAAVGEAVVIMMGSIDLSVGSTIGLGNMITATALSQYYFSPEMAIFAAVIVGGLIGFLNGILVTKGKMPSFVATLATLTGVRGVAYIYSQGINIPIYNNDFLALGDLMLGIPKIFWIFLALLILSTLIFKFTRFGLYIHAIGGNETAARNLGIDVGGVKNLSFTFAGMFAGLAGAMMSVRLGAGYPHSGLGYELDVIAAVVVGGISLVGGSGSLIGGLIGATVMASILNLMVLMGIGAFIQYVARGLVLVVAALAMRGKIAFAR